MTYNEAFLKRALVANIPLVLEGRELSASMQAKVMLMRVAYDKLFNEFEEDVKKALEGFKSEGFDDRLRAYSEMNNVDAKLKAVEEWDGEGDEPKSPTEEEIKNADETRKTKEEFEKELEEVNKKYMEARAQKSNEDIASVPKMFTEDELAEIIRVVTLVGEPIAIPQLHGGEEKISLSREQFIQVVASELVQG